MVQPDCDSTGNDGVRVSKVREEKEEVWSGGRDTVRRRGKKGKLPQDSKLIFGKGTDYKRAYHAFLGKTVGCIRISFLSLATQ